MNSFLYLFSKFTEEFLLLTSAGVCGLLSLYCYEWVIKKRRLGAARDQIPATMVKAYLNQLIAEAQSVRVQLFGLLQANPGDPSEPIPTHQLPVAGMAAGAVSGELMERLRALQGQLAEKESLVVNINIEKTRLLEELESLRRNPGSAAAAAGGTEELAKKVKDLESRLEEYSLFEDDLANLKRLQQENIALKKKLEEMGGTLTLTPSTPEPVEKKKGLSADDLETLLEGKPVTPPEGAAPEAVPEKPLAAPAPLQAAPEPVESKPATPEPLPAAPEPAPALSVAPDPVPTGIAAPPVESFEALVSSVEKSLDAPATPATTPVAPAPASAAPAPAAPTAESAESLAAKTDDELLKEFENLLNS